MRKNFRFSYDRRMSSFSKETLILADFREKYKDYRLVLVHCRLACRINSSCKFVILSDVVFMLFIRNTQESLQQMAMQHAKRPTIKVFV